MRFILWWDGVIKQAEKRRDKHKVRWETTRGKIRWEEMRWDTKWDETGREVGKRDQTEWDEINQGETKPEKTRRCEASVVWYRHQSWNHIHLVAMKGHLLYISVTTIDWVWDSYFSALIKHHPGCTDGQFWVICCVTYRAWMKYGHAAAG